MQALRAVLLPAGAAFLVLAEWDAPGRLPSTLLPGGASQNGATAPALPSPLGPINLIPAPQLGLPRFTRHGTWVADAGSSELPTQTATAYARLSLPKQCSAAMAYSAAAWRETGTRVRRRQPLTQHHDAGGPFVRQRHSAPGHQPPAPLSLPLGDLDFLAVDADPVEAVFTVIWVGLPGYLRPR